MMTQKDMVAKIEELKDLERMNKELEAMIESIKDEIKSDLIERDVEELEAGSHIVRYTTVLSNRFDSTAFKKVMPELYKAYTKQSVSRRFTVA